VVVGCGRHILTAVILLLRISVVVKHERRAGPGVDCGSNVWARVRVAGAVSTGTRTLDKPDFKLFILFKDAIIIEIAIMLCFFYFYF